MSSRNGSRKVTFSPDMINDKPTVHLRSQRRRAPSRNSAHRLCRKAGYLPVRIARYVGANVVRVLCFISCGSRSTSAKVSPKTFSRRFAPPQESHHAEAIEDCIKFINSSSRRSC